VVRFEIDKDTVLHPFAESDAEQIVAAVIENYDHLHKFLYWVVPEYDLESAKEFISRAQNEAEEKKSLGFGIFQNGTPVGSIGFVSFNWPSKRTEIGYWIAKSHEGKGIITRSCKLLISYAFEELQLNRIEILCAAENTRSRAVPERLGFKLEGVLRQSLWRHDRFYDMAAYGLLRQEWSTSNSSILTFNSQTE
jgi:Acetyltransferases, including N-acetylases of ribosomal proteins